eukprot:2611752-Amphidinium_carterae.1
MSGLVLLCMSFGLRTPTNPRPLGLQRVREQCHENPKVIAKTLQIRAWAPHEQASCDACALNEPLLYDSPMGDHLYLDGMSVYPAAVCPVPIWHIAPMSGQVVWCP